MLFRWFLLAAVALLLVMPRLTSAEMPRRDRHNDLLPDGALARLGTVRLRHGNTPDVITFSSDGKRLASMDRNDLVVWDRATGKPLLTLRSVAETVLRRDSLGLSPGGTTVAAVDVDQRLHVWDVASSKSQVHKLAAPPDARYVGSFAFSAQGNTLAVSFTLERDGSTRYNAAVAVYDVNSAKPLSRWTTGCAGRVRALSADGTLLAVQADKEDCHVWNTSTGKDVARL